MIPRLALALGLATIAGCMAPEYMFLPAEQATATISGQVAARYAVPPEAPRGTVRVATSGIVALRPPQGGREIRALQMRLVLANNDDAGPWILDTREQFLEIQGQGQSRAAFVNTNDARGPQIRIESGEKRTIDFYYPLPRGLQRASNIAQFDFAWIVHTPERAVAERTPFDRYRIETESPREPSSFELGAGPNWMYDNAWPRTGFARPVVIEQPRRYLVPAPAVRRVR